MQTKYVEDKYVLAISAHSELAYLVNLAVPSNSDRPSMRHEPFLSGRRVEHDKLFAGDCHRVAIAEESRPWASRWRIQVAREFDKHKKKSKNARRDRPGRIRGSPSCWLLAANI